MVKMWLRNYNRRSPFQSPPPTSNSSETGLISLGGSSTSTSSSPSRNRSVSNSSSDMSDCEQPRACLTLTKKAQKVLRVLDSPRRALLRRSGMKNFEMLHECDSSELPSMNVDRTSLKFQRSQNVLWWIEHEAPSDILPKILSYAGPQKIDSLSRVNKALRSICLTGDVWKTLCEDTQKWTPGIDPDPFQDDDGDACCSDNDCKDNGMTDVKDSDYELKRLNYWKDYYCRNPIVPTDYSTITAAVQSLADDIDEDETSDRLQMKCTTIHSNSGRVLIRPGNYILAERIQVHVKGNAKVTFETLEYPETIVQSMRESQSYSPRPTHQRRRITRSELCDIFTCRSNGQSDDETSIMRPSSNVGRVIHNRNGPLPTKATIELRTKKMNEPIFHVSQGSLQLSKLVLRHNCNGTDIWNGNTAVQSQPLFDEDDRPIRVTDPNTPPTVIAEDCNIMSVSGRGIVSIDGGFSITRRCYIHHCAATGLYIGGPGSTASVESSDIVLNGNGNVRNRRGITRGHSGVYLEQGQASLTDCNISNNSLTGISAVSKQNAFLRLEESDLVGNGTLQLDMPPEGTRSRSRSITKNNNMSADGYARPRSGFLGENGDESSSSERSVYSSQAGSTRRRAISMSSSDGGM